MHDLAPYMLRGIDDVEPSTPTLFFSQASDQRRRLGGTTGAVGLRYRTVVRACAPLLFALATSAHAEPPPHDFGDLEVGLGVASVHSDPRCLDGCYFGTNTDALVHLGLGGGIFVSDRFAIVIRIHGNSALRDTPNQFASFQLFAGAGAHLKLAQLSDERDDYAFFELVTGYEVLGIPEGGGYSGLGLAPRLGIQFGHATFALSSTVQIDRSSATQDDLTLVVGVHLKN